MGKKQAENEKLTFFERLYWVVFQFFIQKHYTWQNNTFWCGIISTRKMRAGYAERSIKQLWRYCRIEINPLAINWTVSLWNEFLLIENFQNTAFSQNLCVVFFAIMNKTRWNKISSKIFYKMVLKVPWA